MSFADRTAIWARGAAPLLTLFPALTIGGAVPIHAAPAGTAADACQMLGTDSREAEIKAEPVAAGGSLGPADTGGGAITLPAHCRVRATLHPAPGSSIGFELWLPLGAAWSGRLQMLGNGGYSSQLPLPDMAAALARGSAVVATDTGHQGDDPDFAIGHPQAIIDWGYRAVHASAVAAKRLVARFYRRAPRHSYFAGCSTGGHQALMEAQRYPADFDGILAGAPGSDRVRLNAAFLWQYLSNHPPWDDAHPILDRGDLAILAHGARGACRGANGGAAGGLASDAWLDDPMQCRFDPAVLQCAPGQASQCLGPDKVAAARRMYRGATDTRTGRILTTPWLPGSESGWSAYWADPRQPDRPARLSFWRVWAFANPDWNWWQFDFGRDLDAVRARLSPVIDATDPDLRSFAARGGKLLHYHGLADPVVSPLDSIRYFGRSDEPGSSAWYRLFLVPGMAHCGGGSGFTRFDGQAALERWVERRAPPDRIIASQGGTPAAATRPLCPYPAHAVFTGGNPAEAGNFQCRPPDGGSARRAGRAIIG